MSTATPSDSSAQVASEKSLLAAMQQYWGYDAFLPLQREAMTSALTGRDSVVVLPTGGGKSLCFQAPAVCLQGLTLVVSPLISLMKDQVDALTACGVPAACVNSTMPASERQEVADRVTSGELKLLYIAPERLLSGRTLDFLQSANLAMAAIDEAHCISSWGHDFRPEYRGLKVLKERFPHIGVHAYTATASRQVQHDMAEQLCLRAPEFLVGSFDRPNLIYKVDRANNRFGQICEVIDRHRNESGIVYCISRKEVDKTAAGLNELGYRALPYHAGLSDEQRHANQEAFIKEECDTVVATVAFGMGIDKSNVRYVVHAGMPKSLENFQQESGRAGRDGLEAECRLIYSGGDFLIWKKMMDQEDANAAAGALRSLEAMQDFCNGVTCRHRTIVNYFGQQLEGDNCGACDVCLGELDEVDDPLTVAQKILSCIIRLEERYGADYTTKVLAGSSEQRIVEAGHDNLSTHGLLSQESTRAIRDWIEQLIGQGYAAKVGEYNTLQVTDDGWKVLRGEATPRLLRPRAKAEKKVARHDDSSWEGVDRPLFEALRTLRKKLADEKNVPAYVVFGDATLRDMARRRPTTEDGMRQVKGVGEKKLADYGDVFIHTINQHCQSEGLAVDVTSSPPAAAVRQSGPNAAALPAFALFRQGMSVDEVAQQLDRAVSTTQGYLTEYLNQERITDPTPWVDPQTAQRIESVAAECEGHRLKPIFEALGGDVDYATIRIVLTCAGNRDQAS